MSNSINIYKLLEAINDNLNHLKNSLDRNGGNLILVKNSIEKNNEIHEKSIEEMQNQTALVINEIKSTLGNSSFINLDDLDDKEERKK